MRSKSGDVHRGSPLSLGDADANGTRSRPLSTPPFEIEKRAVGGLVTRGSRTGRDRSVARARRLKKPLRGPMKEGRRRAAPFSRRTDAMSRTLRGLARSLLVIAAIAAGASPATAGAQVAPPNGRAVELYRRATRLYAEKKLG